LKRAEWHKRPGRSSSWIRRSTRLAVYARDGFDCVYCRSVFPLAYNGLGLTLDHIVSRSRGGTHEPTNLVTACLSCNSKRQHRKHRAQTEKKLLRLAARPLNRELGRVLSKIFR